MSQIWLDLLVFITPFALLFGGILWLRKSVLWAATFATSALLILVSLVWKMSFAAIGTAILKASFVTLDIFFILIGALFLLAILRQTGAITTIKQLLVAISPDKRIQGILIGLFFVGFIEGLAGFGTPAMLAAPLLVAIGFPVRAAILLSLVGDTISVPFGAVGTPFLIGLEQGLGAAAQTSSIDQVIPFVLLFGFPLALLAPLFMSALLTKTFGGSLTEGLKIWKQALLAGVCFVVPYTLIALILGPEFPSLVGSLLGMGMFIFLLKTPFFELKETWDFGGQIHKNIAAHKATSTTLSNKKIVFALVPYMVVVSLLILSRLPSLPFQTWTQNTASYVVPNLPQSPNQSIAVNHTVRPLYSPGLFLLIGALAAIALYRPSSKLIRTTAWQTAKQTLRPTLTLLVLISLAQMLIFSGFNALGKPSLPVFAAEIVSTIPIAWTAIAPFIGLFGALVTGSVTISNVLFGDFQLRTAVLGEYNPHAILALQVLGAAAGNMIALHNIIAVLAAIQTDSKSNQNKRRANHTSASSARDTLLLLLKPALMYAAGVAVLGTLYFFIGNFNTY